jgi:T5SS/PEP-CTERM-associated repeat protein
MSRRMIAVAVGVLCVVMSATLSLAGVATGGDVVPGDPLLWDNATEAYIGDTADGTLTITADSDVVGYRAYVGNHTDSTGVAWVDGVGSTWTNTSEMHVGYYGDGSLVITDGGVVSVVDAGGYSGNTYVAYKPGSTGSVTVDGVGSLLDSRYNLVVGVDGSGTLDVLNGGQVESTYGFVGGDIDATSVATINGPGSTWTTVGGIGVSGGDATLNVTGGGQLLSFNQFSSDQIGVLHNSQGTLTVEGSGSVWSSQGEVRLGQWGHGTVNVTCPR